MFAKKETGIVISKITKDIDCCEVYLNKSLYSQFFTQLIVAKEIRK